MGDFISRESAKRLLVSDYAYAAADLLDEVPAADVVEAPRWISVKDKLPKEHTMVLVYCMSEMMEKHITVSMMVNCDNNRKIWCWSRKVRGVTHWMPLPEPPKEGDGT